MVEMFTELIILLISAAVTVYFRYKMISEYLEHRNIDSKHLRRSNIAGLIIGLCIALGISLVCNFQVVDP